MVHADEDEALSRKYIFYLRTISVSVSLGTLISPDNKTFWPLEMFFEFNFHSIL